VGGSYCFFGWWFVEGLYSYDDLFVTCPEIFNGFYEAIINWP